MILLRSYLLKWSRGFNKEIALFSTEDLRTARPLFEYCISVLLLV